MLQAIQRVAQLQTSSQSAGATGNAQELRGQIAMVRLQQQRVRGLNTIQTPVIQTLLGDAAVNKEAAKKQQLDLLKEAEQTCQTALTRLEKPHSSSGGKSLTDAKTDMRAEFSSLADNIPALRKLLANQEVSPEEWQSIMKGLLTASADLTDGGCQGQGHFYICINKHPYVIGDCGGAVETSACPECGARIGGT